MRITSSLPSHSSTPRTRTAGLFLDRIFRAAMLPQLTGGQQRGRLDRLALKSREAEALILGVVFSETPL